MSKRTGTVLIAAVVAAAGAGAWWWRMDPPRRVVEQAPAAADTVGQDADGLVNQRSRGDTAAPIVILEASDFQCPFCRDFWAQTLPHIEREYIATGKVRLIFLNFPIAQLHPNAPAAHEFAMCAARQGRFWQIHDLLYRHQGDWARLPDPSTYFGTLADSAHLSREALNSCIARGAVRPLIQSEATQLWQAGIKSTPSFVVEGLLIAGFEPFTTWKPILDSIYAAKTADVAGGK